METKIKIRQQHKGISSPELGLRWSQSIKKQRHYFPTKVPVVKAMVFPVVMYGCERWTIKKAECLRVYWFFWTVMLEKTLQSPLNCKIKPVNPKGNQVLIFTGRTDAETEAPILWPLDEKSRLIRKDPDDGKDWRQEKGMTEDQMVGWHLWFNGHESEQAIGDGEGQGSLACCSPWGRKQLDMTEQLNNRLGETPGTWQKKIQSLYIKWDTIN